MDPDKTWEEWSREVAEMMMRDIGVDLAYKGPDEALRGFWEDGDSPKEVLKYYKMILDVRRNI